MDGICWACSSPGDGEGSPQGGGSTHGRGAGEAQGTEEERVALTTRGEGNDGAHRHRENQTQPIPPCCKGFQAHFPRKIPKSQMSVEFLVGVLSSLS